MDFFKEIKKAADSAAEVASRGASQAGSIIADTATKAASSVSEAASQTIETASEGANSAFNAAKEAVDTASQTEAGKFVGKHLSTVNENLIKPTVDNVASKAGVCIDFINENSPSAYLKRARLQAFEDGIMQGIYLANEAKNNYFYAFVLTLMYFLYADGEFSEDERTWLSQELCFIKSLAQLSDEAFASLEDIVNRDDITFSEVKDSLNNVNLSSLGTIAEKAVLAGEVTGYLAPGEIAAREELNIYIQERISNPEFDENRIRAILDASVQEYSENIDSINNEFKNRTKLQDHDFPFLFVATALQVLRVYLINYLTQIEGAGAGNRNEDWLHDKQEQLFSKIDSSYSTESGKYYASTEQILTTPGVPYDITRYEDINHGIFSDANHRFATYGHDPLLGLVFGTSNIATNCITCTGNPFLSSLGLGFNLPTTYEVIYDDAFGHARIGNQASTIQMLSSAGGRLLDDPKAMACSLLKYLIHTGTDLFTPCGIQLPFANFVLNKANAEKLTKYISTGDIIKVGAQAGVAVFINWLISALHGCSLIFQDDGTDYCTEMYQVRTKKIILLSNTIATGSSVIANAIPPAPKGFDLGGAAVLVYRLFTDGRFIARLKEDFLNSELDKIYETRAEGLL